MEQTNVIGVQFYQGKDSYSKTYYFYNATGHRPRIGDLALVRGYKRHKVWTKIVERDVQTHRIITAHILEIRKIKNRNNPAIIKEMLAPQVGERLQVETSFCVGIQFKRNKKVYYYRNQTGKIALVGAQALVIGYHGTEQWVKVVEINATPNMNITKSILDLRYDFLPENALFPERVYTTKLPMI